MNEDNWELGSSLMQMTEALDSLQAVCVARRDKLVADGFSPAAAEQMVMAMWAATFGGVE